MRGLMLQPEFKSLFSMMDDVFEPRHLARFSPLSEWTESEKGIDLSLEVPGVRPEDITLTAKNGMVRIEGEKRYEKSDKESTKSERFYGHFVREFSVPEYVSLEGADATFEHGVLKVHMPRIAEPKARTIEIKKA